MNHEQEVRVGADTIARIDVPVRGDTEAIEQGCKLRRVEGVAFQRLHV